MQDLLTRLLLKNLMTIFQELWKKNATKKSELTLFLVPIHKMEFLIIFSCEELQLWSNSKIFNLNSSPTFLVQLLLEFRLAKYGAIDF